MHESKDVEELRGVLKAVREEIPGLLREIVEPLKELLGITFTEEEAKERAKAIAAFYKELVGAGIEKDLALRLTEKNFVNPLDIVNRFLDRQQARGSQMYERREKEKKEE